MHKINKSREKVWKAKYFHHIVNGHQLEAGIIIEMKCDISICECVEWMQDLRVGAKSCTFVKIIVWGLKGAGGWLCEWNHGLSVIVDVRITSFSVVAFTVIQWDRMEVAN